jgi:hypothetical protein
VENAKRDDAEDAKLFEAWKVRQETNESQISLQGMESTKQSKEGVRKQD